MKNRFQFQIFMIQIIVAKQVSDELGYRIKQKSIILQHASAANYFTTV